MAGGLDIGTLLEHVLQSHGGVNSSGADGSEAADSASSGNSRLPSGGLNAGSLGTMLSNLAGQSGASVDSGLCSDVASKVLGGLTSGGGLKAPMLTLFAKFIPTLRNLGPELGKLFSLFQTMNIGHHFTEQVRQNPDASADEISQNVLQKTKSGPSLGDLPTLISLAKQIMK